MRRLVLAVAAIFLCPLLVRADTVETFTSPWETADAALSPVTFTVAGNPHFGFTSYRRRLSENKLGEAHMVNVNFSEYFMFVYASHFKGALHVEYNQPSMWISALSDFFKNGSKVDIRENGHLALSAYLEYSLFKYPFEQPRDCAAFNGSSTSFSIGGVFCAPTGKDLTKSDLERYLGAVGYPGLLDPKPLAAVPLVAAAGP